jgi:hypothetical protein
MVKGTRIFRSKFKGGFGVKLLSLKLILLFEFGFLNM